MHIDQRPTSTTCCGLSIIVALCLASVSWAATLQGDCDNSGTVEIFKVQRCVNGFLDPQTLSRCPACDQNGDGDVDIGEVQGATNCFRDTSSPDCLMITPQPTVAPSETPTPAPTDTVPVPTDTPTPLPTDTVPAPSETPTATFTAVATDTPTPGSAVCGDFVVESPETCDDGNTTEGCTLAGCDPCPSNCMIESCVPDGTMTQVNVNFQSPQPLISITLYVEYPDGVVQIPGAGTATSVGQRVINRPPGYLATFVDFDYLLRGGLSGGSPFSNARLFTINFDDCTSAPPVTLGDFTCTVLEAVNQSFQNVAGATCSVSFP